jgi:hypothetical protein
LLSDDPLHPLPLLRFGLHHCASPANCCWRILIWPVGRNCAKLIATFCSIGAASSRNNPLFAPTASRLERERRIEERRAFCPTPARQRAAGGTVFISPYTLRHFAATPEMLVEGVTVPKDPPVVHKHMFEPGDETRCVVIFFSQQRIP